MSIQTANSVESLPLQTSSLGQCSLPSVGSSRPGACRHKGHGAVDGHLCGHCCRYNPALGSKNDQWEPSGSDRRRADRIFFCADCGRKWTAEDFRKKRRCGGCGKKVTLPAGWRLFKKVPVPPL